MLLYGLALTFFFGFAKRCAELNVMDDEGGSHREVFDDYDPVLLDKMIAFAQRVRSSATVCTR